MKTALILSLLLVFGCSKEKPGLVTLRQVQAADPAYLSNLEARVGMLESKSALNSNLMTLAEFVSTLRNRVDNLEAAAQVTRPEWFAVDMTEHAFSLVQTRFLPLLILPVNATPYLDGYRITLDIGNPYKASMNGLTINANWELPQTNNTISFDDATKAPVKRREFDRADVLASGQWTRVTLDIAPASAEEIRCLRMQLDINSVGLAAASDK